MMFSHVTFLFLDVMNVTTATPPKSLTEMNPNFGEFEKMLEDKNQENIRGNELQCEFVL